MGWLDGIFGDPFDFSDSGVECHPQPCPCSMHTAYAQMAASMPDPQKELRRLIDYAQWREHFGILAEMA